ncbi:UDP-N-acetylglucosamine 2-epimerase [Basilea psittacipulmonis]|uniref:UDP-N-acetylglucosamine 2-epimerase n=1 Tax=Basilea psittacipulmonis DSM 24701 TaxID=1072685 RepID=A0A077DIS9_9BURK|nr:UDP-N-acetylglucosamine 2-epimerase [Basilea psittacipulmonis]AIL33063.1 UDP-N-acetylglucosamine 2-epimerase [Basilea psittacipulmonis DSM 24701]
MKKILCITGTRADFGKLKPLLSFLESHFELHVVVTGMHMLSRYGSTFLEVQRERYKNIYLIPNQTDSEPMSSVIANTINILNRQIDFIKPDMIIIHGDRVEALAGAIAGSLNNTLVCHIEGGELSGTIDDSIRHAISKLSQIHMVCNEKAKERLIKMGENPQAIFTIGSPDIDIMLNTHLPSIEETKKHYDITFNDYAISLFHPVTTEYEDLAKYAKQYFAALAQSGKNYIVVYPNNDLGSDFIISEIKSLSTPNFKCFPSIRFEYFLTLLKHANFIIGNSSAGVREAPIYRVPAINVGTRQNKRSHMTGIKNCGYNTQEIIDAIQTIHDLSLPSYTHFEFGTGDSASLFKQYIESPELWSIPIQKTFYQ